MIQRTLQMKTRRMTTREQAAIDYKMEKIKAEQYHLYLNDKAE